MLYSVTITYENGAVFTGEVEAPDPGTAEVIAEGDATAAGYGRCAAGVTGIEVKPSSV